MLPAHIRDELDAYKQGNHPYEFGSFLTAILANDLVRAACTADQQNQHLLFEYAKYLYNELPSHMWGSYKTVQAQIAHQQTQRQGNPD